MLHTVYFKATQKDKADALFQKFVEEQREKDNNITGPMIQGFDAVKKADSDYGPKTKDSYRLVYNDYKPDEDSE